MSEHHEDDTTRATARLPGLEIEIVHRISINLQASFYWPTGMGGRGTSPMGSGGG
jgi:hypothetical protein